MASVAPLASSPAPLLAWWSSVAVAGVLLYVATAALATLIALVVVRKASRDRSERASLVRRGVFAAALASGSAEGLAPLLSAATRSVEARRDLATVLAREPVRTHTGRLHTAVRRARLDLQLLDEVERRSAPDRGLAVLLACRLRLPEAVGMAAGRLNDPDPDVRLAAAAGLEHLGTPAAARSLIGALDLRTLPPERIIERLAGLWAVPELVRALEQLPHPGEDAPMPPLRASLARALGIAGSVSAEPAMLWLLESGAFEERIAAARALGTCGTARSIPALVDALDDEAWPLRVQALRSLGQLRAVEAADRMAELLADGAWWARAAAADALRDLGPAGIARLEAAREHPDRYARDRAREALALERVLTGEPPAEAPLVEPEPVLTAQPDPDPEPIAALGPEPAREPESEPERTPDPTLTPEPEPAATFAPAADLPFVFGFAPARTLEPQPLPTWDPEPEPEPELEPEPEPEPEPRRRDAAPSVLPLSWTVVPEKSL